MGHKIYLKNSETGEERMFINKVEAYRAPWRIDRIEKYLDPDSAAGRVDAKLAVWAEKIGIPVAAFADAARWLLAKDCPFCQLGSRVLKRIEELGPETTEWALAEILAAKDRGDADRLVQIRELLCLDKPTSLT